MLVLFNFELALQSECHGVSFAVEEVGKAFHFDSDNALSLSVSI